MAQGSQRRLGISLVLFAFVFVGAHWCYDQTRGIEVIVHNADRRPLGSIDVLVNGKAYELGDLDPDATRSVYVQPAGDSGVSVSAVDAAGHRTRLGTLGYLERGYTGTISIEVTATGIRAHDVHVGPSFVPHCFDEVARHSLLAAITPGPRTR